MLIIFPKCSKIFDRVECASAINIKTSSKVVLFHKNFLSFANFHILNDKRMIECKTFFHSNIFKTGLLKVYKDK